MHKKQIMSEVNKVLHKHEKAKKVLINLIFRAQLRCNQKWTEHIGEASRISNMNCLLVGKSGTGKTYLVETLSKIMGVHIVKFDATTFAPTSANGTTSKDVIKKIKTSAEEFYQYNKYSFYCVDEVLDQTIVFVDELDKLGEEFSSNNWQTHTQSNFLTLFENKELGLENISWIFAGAFTNMFKEKVKEKRSIGFDSIDIISEDKDVDLETQIIRFGMIPELVGRINHVVKLDDLVLEDYVHILENIIIPKKIKQLSHTDIEYMTLLDLDLNLLAKRAFNSELGVRMLTKLIDDYLIDLEFEECKFKLTPLASTKMPKGLLALSAAPKIASGKDEEE